MKQNKKTFNMTCMQNVNFNFANSSPLGVSPTGGVVQFVIRNLKFVIDNADTEVHIVLGETSDFDTDIYIHDLLGVLRASGEIAADDWEDTIATSSLPSGVYVISIWQDGLPVKATQLLILH